MGVEVSENARSEQEKIEIVLRDLDVLLRKRLGHALIVDSFTTDNLVPIGENYGSSVLKIDAIVRRDGQESKPEKLFLVGKMTPPTEFLKMMFRISSTFPKEIYMFEEIIPAYKALEHECGIPEEERFDPLPGFYGARLSLKDQTKFDHDAIILMENLKAKNYRCYDRRTGIDLAGAKLVLETLARFHALGIAAKLKKPKLFEEFMARSKSAIFGKYLTLSNTEAILKFMTKIPAVVPYVARVEKKIRDFPIEVKNPEPIEPWGTITHGDLWVNNIMFRKEDNGDTKDVKFLDFQGYHYLNPLRDLVFFIFTSCEERVRNQHLDHLFDFYHEKFTAHLARLKCDASPFSRKYFNEQIAIAGNLEYVHCLGMIHIFTAELSDERDTMKSEVELQPQFTDHYSERLTDITLNFVKANWI